LDEELLERQQQLQQEKQLSSRQQGKPGLASQPRQQQQQARQRLDGQPQSHPPGEQQFLSIRQLQLLTELHVDDAYALGVAGSAAELADLLGSSLRDGLCESQASA
jgi:hypothetical protein